MGDIHTHIHVHGDAGTVGQKAIAAAEAEVANDRSPEPPVRVVMTKSQAARKQAQDLGGLRITPKTSFKSQPFSKSRPVVTEAEQRAFAKNKLADKARRAVQTQRRKPMSPRTNADFKESLADIVRGSVVVKGRASKARHPQTGKFVAEPGSESDAMTAMATGSIPAAGLSPQLSAVQAAMRGEQPPEVTGTLDATDVNGIPGGGDVSPEYVAKCERVARDPSATPQAREAAGEAVTRYRLTMGALGVQPAVKATNGGNMEQHLQRLEQLLKSGKVKDPRLLDEMGATVTFHRLSQQAAGQNAIKGIVQNALNGTATPETTGVSDFPGARSGIASQSVTAGVKTPPSDSALVMGGESTYEIPDELRVQTNPTATRADAAGVINPQALSKCRAELAAEKNPARRQRLGEQVTALQLGHSGVGLAA